MPDPRTMEYLRNLRLAQEPAEKAKESGQEICTCADCIESRMKKQISQCDKNRLLQYLPMEIVKPNPSNFVPEMSPNYELWYSGKRRSF